MESEARNNREVRLVNFILTVVRSAGEILELSGARSIYINIDVQRLTEM